MTREEAKSCISTIEMLQRLAYNIHGVMDVIDADNCEKIIKALEQEPSGDLISREPFTDSTICEGFSCDECSFNRKDKGGCILEERVMNLPSVKQEPKTGHWIEHPEIETSTPEYLMFYECSECGNKQCFYTADTHRRNYCGECGCRMVAPQEREE